MRIIFIKKYIKNQKNKRINFSNAIKAPKKEFKLFNKSISDFKTKKVIIVLITMTSQVLNYLRRHRIN